jgi:hypothetical protein
LEADPKVRTVVNHFLSGRTLVPFENSVVRIEPVCLATMNARPKPSLEGRTAFSTAQLRRLVLCDVDHIPLPDLALIGEQPLEAAAQHVPITVPSPRHNCQQYRAHVVRLLRDVMTPEAQSLVDVEMVILLCGGMTGFIEDDERAVQQAVYNFALVTQTLNWVQSDWLAMLSGFSLHGIQTAVLPPPATSARSTASLSDTIILRRRIMDDHESLVPHFSISEKQKAQLIWMSEQERVPVEHALDVLLEYYRSLGDRDLDDLNSIIRLSKELKLRELSAQAIYQYMKMINVLTERNQTLDHLDAALDMLPALERAGLAPGTVPADETIHIAARLAASGVTIAQTERWLTRHLRRQRTAASSESKGIPAPVTAQRPLDASDRPESGDMPQ